MTNDPTIKDVLEVVEFIRDNAVTRDDLQAVRNEMADGFKAVKNEMKEDVRVVKNEMIEHVDGFIALYQKHEVELAAVVHRQERLEEKLNKIIRHLNLELA